MVEVASRELRNHTRELLDRVASGEQITITVRGRPVADLVPVAHRPQWLLRDRFVEEILPVRADAGLSDDLALLYEGTTDDLPWD